MKSDTQDPDVAPPAAKLLSRRLIQIAASGEVTIAYEAQPEFTNRHGTVQGGLLAAMLDSATAFALLQALPAGKTAVTTRLDTTFLKAARPGTLIAIAAIEYQDECTALVVAELKSDQSVVVARARAELRILNKSPG
jgi:uncharacterized protein (TIGR00369 family)